MSLSLIGNETVHSEAFVVRLFNKRIVVISPKKFLPKTHVIIENKTLSKVIGKVGPKIGQNIQYVTIGPQSSESVELKVGKNEKIFFVPLAPAFQEVQLLAGKRRYEIPPKK